MLGTGLRRRFGRLGVRSKLVLVSLMVLGLAGGAGGLVAERSLERVLVERIETELSRQVQAARVAAQTAPPGQDLDALATALHDATKARVTFIAADGRVLGDSGLNDSELARADNHATRPEVKTALLGQQGAARRASATVGEDLLYVAVAADVHGERVVVRAATSLASVREAHQALRVLFAAAALVSLLVALLMSALSAHWMSRTLRALIEHARAQASGVTRGEAFAGDEIAHLSNTFQALAGELERSLSTLAQERDRFEAVLAAMGEGVIALDDEGTVALANPAARALLGLDVYRGLIGERLDDVVTGADANRAVAEVIARARQAPAGTASQQTEVDLLGQHPRRVLVRASATRAFGGVVVVLHDMTEVRRLEALRRDFVANVSHELRTPVSVILANAETLLHGALEDGPRAARFVEAVHRNAERLSRLIADLLDIARIEAGKQTFTQVPVRLRGVCDHVAIALEPRAQEKNHTLNIDVDDGVHVVGDYKALDQVVFNLVDNAVKYTPAGGHIHVRARTDGDRVRFEVEDDGPGVAAKHRVRLFERFYRVDPGRSRDVGGTGLGLAIVKHLVEAMDGTVGVEPAEPQGTRFVISLPRAVVDVDARAA